jgi:hypothetical protein
MESEQQPQENRLKTRRLGYLKNGNPPCDLRSLPKCQASAKSTGKRCGNVAMKGKKVCYLHGGKSPGAPTGNMNALKHGNNTTQAKLERKYVSRILKESRRLISEFKVQN